MAGAQPLQLAKTKVKYDSAGNIKQAGYFPQNPVTDEPPLLAGLPTWGFLFGGKFYNTSTHKFELNSPGNVRALQWMVVFDVKRNGWWRQ